MKSITPLRLKTSRLLIATSLMLGIGFALLTLAQAPQDHQGPIPPIAAGYGSWGGETLAAPESFQITSQGYSNTITLYFPEGQIAPAPTLFFAPGWEVDCDSYAELFRFWVSKGYVAVCDDYYEDSGKIGAQLRDSFVAAASLHHTRIYTGKIGLMGHSSGAGLLPSVGYELVKNEKWGGADGQNTFIFSSAPWIDFDITDTMVLSYPTGVKLIVQSYEDDKGTDLRTYIQAFEGLPAIPDAEKDFITLRATTVNTYTYQANHAVIATGGNGYGVFDALDDYGVFRLVDALADYTFTGNLSAKNVALGDGSDAQIEMGDLRDLISTDDPRPIPGETYGYPCDIHDNPRRDQCDDYDLNYKVYLPLILLASSGSEPLTSISTEKSHYAPNEPITVHLANMSGDAEDWVGIYPAGSSNDWENVVSWEFTGGIISGTLQLDGVAAGEYEARAFFRNSFNLEAKTAFSVY